MCKILEVYSKLEIRYREVLFVFADEICNLKISEV